MYRFAADHSAGINTHRQPGLYNFTPLFTQRLAFNNTSVPFHIKASATMRRLVKLSFFTATVLTSFPALAQEPLYLDTGYKRCPPDSAIYVAAFSMEAPHKYKVIIRNRKDNSLHVTAYSTMPDSLHYTGKYVSYYPNGNQEWVYTYENNNVTGTEKHYYDDGKTLCHTFDNETGKLKGYYKSGKLKREQTEKTRGQNTRVKNGRSYDEQGNPINFIPFEVMPEPTFDISTYLSENMHYPEEAIKLKLTGKVLLRFEIKPTGEISDITIVKSAGELLDNEARRVVSTMPRWKPGIQDDIPVSVFYTLPIAFSLR